MVFELINNKETHKDVLGYDKDIWFNHAVARPLKHGERAQFKEEQKEQRENDNWERICRDLIELVRTQPRKSRSHYERLPVAQGGVKASQERKERAMSSMIDDGVLEVIHLEKAVGRATHYVQVDEAVLSSASGGKYSV
jgi:hypothetical protein